MEQNTTLRWRSKYLDRQKKKKKKAELLNNMDVNDVQLDAVVFKLT